ncbi:hypothetical protein Xph01_09140 [Micromonospora phaseoli]|nr:hypothetical protein Xph01_09140 [Micromonospora phaseoli]
MGTPFHSLQATSHALQPMQTLVSVKKPILGGASTQPAADTGSPPDARSALPAGAVDAGVTRSCGSTVTGSPLRRRVRRQPPAHRE